MESMEAPMGLAGIDTGMDIVIPGARRMSWIALLLSRAITRRQLFLEMRLPSARFVYPPPTLLLPAQPHLTMESGAQGVSRMNYTHTDLPPATQDEDSEDLALPSIDSFSFEGIMKAIDPAGNSRLLRNLTLSADP